MLHRLLLLFYFVIVSFGQLQAQSTRYSGAIQKITLETDTALYSTKEHILIYKKQPHLYFFYGTENPVCDIKIYPYSANNLQRIRLLPSADFEQMDSLRLINGQFYRVKVQFKNITESNFLRLTVAYQTASSGQEQITEWPLMPCTETTAEIRPNVEDLYIGEEKIFEISSNTPQNIIAPNTWQTGKQYDYKISRKNNLLRLHIVPNQLGKLSIEVPLKTIKPFLNATQIPLYHLPDIAYTFNVKKGRLAFLNIDKDDVTLGSEAKSGIEIQIENHRGLRMQKTYRIEKQQEAGSPFVGEIFTRSRLSNDQVLCWLRVYDYHRKSDGYLYVKDGDESRYITNFNITPKTSITGISILREGSDYAEGTTVYPGESVELKIEGVALDKSHFTFEDLQAVRSDSMVRNDNTLIYKFTVPKTLANGN